MENYGDDSYSSKTERSGDLGTLSRIDGLLRQCIMATNTQDFTMWFSSLANIYKEAIPYFDKKKATKDKINKLKAELESEYIKYIDHVNRFNNLRQNDRSRYGFNYNGNVYYLLESYEVELRLILSEAGLLMRTIKESKDIIG